MHKHMHLHMSMLKHMHMNTHMDTHTHIHLHVHVPQVATTSGWPASAPPTRGALPTCAAEARSRRGTIGAVSGRGSGEGRGVGFSKAKFSKGVNSQGAATGL